MRACAWVIGSWLACVAVLTGCHGSLERASYPDYYQRYDDLPSALQTELDTARKQAQSTARSSDDLLHYAHVTARLARQEASNWFELRATPPESRPEHSWRCQRARRRVLESCAQSLSLFQEFRLEGGTLDWNDRIQVAHLLLLQGSQGAAEEILYPLLSHPEVADPIRNQIRAILNSLAAAGEERKP